MVKTFTPIYIKQFALSTIEQIKQEKNAKASQLQLLEPPKPSEPLQTGLLTKQGAIQKNWKLRFFVGQYFCFTVLICFKFSNLEP